VGFYYFYISIKDLENPGKDLEFDSGFQVGTMINALLTFRDL
jgi:hypothetical protein